MIADAHQPFRIGPAVLAPGAPTFVIAELGVNHDGEVGLARELIHAAADAEADAVKFQVFAASRLVTRSAPAADYQQRAVGADSQYDMLRELELTYDEFADLFDYAGHCGVEFLATPFSVEDLAFLVSLNVRAIKLASPDIVNPLLLDAAAAARRPVIASTGAAEHAEVAAAVERFHRPGAGPLALLHCISSYPTPEYEANLAAIGTLAQSFGCISGFSDHTESVTIGGYAAAAGARIIEKHMTLDRTRCGPDHALSLEPDQMAAYIRHIHQTEILLGHGRITVSDCEREVRQLARSSVVAACDIAAGAEMTHTMLTIKRPGGGIPAAQINTLIGRHTRRPIPADTPIEWETVC